MCLYGPDHGVIDCVQRVRTVVQFVVHMAECRLNRLKSTLWIWHMFWSRFRCECGQIDSESPSSNAAMRYKPHAPLIMRLPFDIQDGFSPLIAAAMGGHMDAAISLLKHDAKIDDQTTVIMDWGVGRGTRTLSEHARWNDFSQRALHSFGNFFE